MRLALIDLHCHLLPGIDDGPSTLEDAVALARAAVAAGTRTIVATPHVSFDYPGNTAASIADGVEEIRAELDRRAVALEVRPGAEVALTRAVDLPDDELLALRLGGPGGTYLLVECPFSPTATGFEPALELLLARGHRILLAHPERCPAFQRDPALFERLCGRGMLGQVTAGALVGRFGRTVQDTANDYVARGLVQVAASDGHGAEHRRPSIGAELAEAGYGAQADWLARAVPGAILGGGSLPPSPAMPMPRRSGLARLFGR